MEKIDIIQYNADDELFIREALSPATVSSISLDKKKKIATVNVDEEQAPLAIGRNGVNVNLASKLTGYEINIEQMESEQAVEKEIDEAIDNEPQGDVDESTVVETELTEDVKAEEAVVAENEVVEAEAEETPQEEPTETENSEEKKEEETSA